MSSAKEKRFKKLKRKRIWPSILVFVLFVVMCVVTIGIFLQLFVTYLMGTKVAQHYEGTQHVSEVMDQLLADGASIEEAAAEMNKYVMDYRDIYVVDSSGNRVFSTGDSAPNFNLVLGFDMGQDFVAVADTMSTLAHGEGLRAISSMSLTETFRGMLDMGKQGENFSEWMDETLICQEYWLQSSLQDGKYDLYVKCDIQFKRQDIAYVCFFGVAVLVLLLVPVILLFASTIRSIVTQRRMTKLLYMDTVTGGRNWLYFQNYGERILTRLVNKNKAFAIVNLHFERYQNYCACYGVKSGEELLEAMDGFLKARIGKYEFFARHEGADFGMLFHCEGETEQEQQESCRKRVRTLLAELTGLKPERKIHFHAGINMIPPYVDEEGKWYHGRKGVDIDQLYTYANAARMESDWKDEQGITFFDHDMLSRQVWERWVEDTMEAALRDEEFQVYLQPKYSPSNAKLVGAEALVRWISPTEGLIAPNRFIPIFEATGFITKLDDYMISHVAKLQAEWTIQGRKMIPVSVNVSRAHFASEGLAEHICQLVDAYGPRHELIELEVTESAFFDDKDILVETVKQLRAYGFHVSMDDFGAGYSSLNSLKDIPLDVLKLDGEFFRGDDDGRGEIVVKEAIQLARSLDMRVVAEGIERKEQVDFLARQGCDMIQGFYFAKPMPIAEFEEKVEKDA